MPGLPEAISRWSGQLDVGGEAANNWHVKRATKFGPSYFQQSGGALIALTDRKCYACAVTYVPCRILLQQFSLGMRPHKSGMHNYVSTSAENGPCMHRTQ